MTAFKATMKCAKILNCDVVFYFARAGISSKLYQKREKKKKSVPCPISIMWVLPTSDWLVSSLIVSSSCEMKKTVISMPNVLNNALLQTVHLLCSYNDRCMELISLSKKCSLKIRPETNAGTQLWNALKLFLGDKLLLRNIDPSTQVTPIEFIRQVIERDLHLFLFCLQSWHLSGSNNEMDMGWWKQN